MPPRLAAIRAFIVGAEAVRLLGNTETELIALVGQDLTRWMSMSAEPLFTTVYKWPNSMPQYVVGHRKRQERITGVLRARPRLHLVGNAYEGVGIPDCIRLAKNVAHAVKAGKVA
jgi:oxygen-dependent protoporphyrinogen oxidase